MYTFLLLLGLAIGFAFLLGNVVVADAQKAIDEKNAELQKLIAKTTELSKEVAAKGDKAADEERKKVNDMISEAERLSTDIKNLKRLQSLDAEVNKPAGKTGLTPAAAVTDVKAQVFSRISSLKSFKGEQGGRKADERAYRFGMFAKAVLMGSKGAVKFCEENGIELKSQIESDNARGGFLVPPEFSNDLIDLREEYGVARKLAKVVPMNRDVLSVPRRRSGLTAYFVGEAQPITESSKTWDQVNLVAKKLGALSLYSSELNEDAIVNIGDDLAGEISYAFAQKEDNCYFNGDGSSTYGGIVGIGPKLRAVNGTIGSIKGLVVASGNAYSEILLADFHRVIARLPLYARKGAKWVMSTTVFDTVMFPLQTAAGGNTVADIANGGQQRFLGYPVEFAQVLPVAEANSQIMALFGNFAMGTTFGDRRQVTIKTSEEYKFAEDMLAIKGTERFDINVHDVGDTDVAGPIVGLITAAA